MQDGGKDRDGPQASLAVAVAAAVPAAPAKGVESGCGPLLSPVEDEEQEQGQHQTTRSPAMVFVAAATGLCLPSCSSQNGMAGS